MQELVLRSCMFRFFTIDSSSQIQVVLSNEILLARMETSLGLDASIIWFAVLDPPYPPPFVQGPESHSQRYR